jgi:hypothetical protein
MGIGGAAIIASSGSGSGRASACPVCPHCHHALPGWKPPIKSIFDNLPMIFFSETLVFFVFMYLLQTILEWASPSDDKPVTLVAVLVTQCHWLVALMHRIW